MAKVLPGPRKKIGPCSSLIKIIGLRNFRNIVLENFGIECLANQYIRVFETIEKLGKVNKK